VFDRMTGGKAGRGSSIAAKALESSRALSEEDSWTRANFPTHPTIKELGHLTICGPPPMP